MDLMIDIEGLATTPDTTILTIAAQEFNPLERGTFGRDFYARVTLESQEGRAIDDATLEWWASQPEVIREEAFGEDHRVPLRQALEGLHRVAWHARRVWAQGPTYDMNILEHAYKSLSMPLPWKFFSVRDSRTLFSLVPKLNTYPASHHALEDCRRQIQLLWDCMEFLKVTSIK